MIFEKGKWENDKSEIRVVKFEYWTVGHVLKTGLVIPGGNKKQEFSSLKDFLAFFENGLVRITRSPHEKELAICYREYVLSKDNP
ncbi:MAG: hypothetical protein LBV46_00655 [Bacteroidales bacterium]|jgi:hypothetical protein|nr:hypothetical protein [Bacteroidales bacterium]